MELNKVEEIFNLKGYAENFQRITQESPRIFLLFTTCVHTYIYQSFTCTVLCFKGEGKNSHKIKRSGTTGPSLAMLEGEQANLGLINDDFSPIAHNFIDKYDKIY